MLFLMFFSQVDTVLQTSCIFDPSIQYLDPNQSHMSLVHFTLVAFIEGTCLVWLIVYPLQNKTIKQLYYSYAIKNILQDIIGHMSPVDLNCCLALQVETCMSPVGSHPFF